MRNIIPLLSNSFNTLKDNCMIFQDSPDLHAVRQRADKAFADMEKPETEGAFGELEKASAESKQNEQVRQTYESIKTTITKFMQERPEKVEAMGMDKLFQRAEEITLANLEKEGIVLSPEQKEAVHELVMGFKKSVSAQPGQAEAAKKEEKKEVAEAKLRKLKLPENIDVDAVANRMPDRYEAASAVRTINLARTQAQAMLRVQIVRSIYQALGLEARLVEMQLSLFKPVSFENKEGKIIASLTLNHDDKVNLIKDFIKQQSA